MNIVRDNSGVQYPHLQLVDWPFTGVPSPKYCTFMADRRQATADIEKIVRVLARRDASTMQLFWAWFGAGKTHSLYYLCNRLNNEGNVVARFTEFPRGAAGFRDLVRSLTSTLDLQWLEDRYLECATSQSQAQGLDVASSFVTVIETAITTSQLDQKRLAHRWLRCEDLSRSECRSLGVSNCVNSADAGIDYMRHLVSVLVSSGSRRLVWVIDEFQRLESLSRSVRLNILSGLHSTFNACPAGLSTIISFSGEPEPHLPPWLSPEIADRIGLEPTIVLPPLQRPEAKVFISETLEHFRPQGYQGAVFYPFTEQAVDEMIDWVAGAVELKPRSLMQAANAVLEENEEAIQRGERREILPQDVKRTLSARKYLLDG